MFEINEGATTLVSRIAVVGNHAFSENRLREVIASREEAFWRFLSNSDQYDPERVNFDKELLRRFYLKNGYADFEVKERDCRAWSPDRSPSCSRSSSTRVRNTRSARSTSTASCATSTSIR